MIIIKNSLQIEKMRQSGKIVSDALKMLEDAIKPGISTAELDQLAYQFVLRHNATPSFLHYNGFPNSLCVSIDDEVIHGIPSKKRFLEEGSIVSLDFGVCLNGFHADAARTFAVGKVCQDKKQLIQVTRDCFFAAFEIAKEGVRLGDIGAKISAKAAQYGYSVVRDFVGHGIGEALHEDPSVPNFGIVGRGLRLFDKMAVAIEPMINMGRAEVRVLADGWTVVTADGKPSAHYENTVLICKENAEILTL